MLFVNENFTRHIDGVHFRESRGLLEFLREWIVQPEFTYTHKWRQNGIAIWDNRTTQHYALADYWPQRRVNNRVTFNRATAGPTLQSTHHAIVDRATAAAVQARPMGSPASAVLGRGSASRTRSIRRSSHGADCREPGRRRVPATRRCADQTLSLPNALRRLRWRPCENCASSCARIGGEIASAPAYSFHFRSGLI